MLIHQPHFPPFQGIILLAVGSITGFAVCYSFGTICALMSSGFLFGPINQLKSMFKASNRRISADIEL